MEYYTSEKITAHVTVIRSLSGEILYLIEGEEGAVLIDTCAGVGHLRRFVEDLIVRDSSAGSGAGLKSASLTVLLSHGHIDHAMGAPEFERVYMNLKDRPLYQSQCSVAERKGYVVACVGEGQAKQISEEAYVPASPEYPFEALEDGMQFDLGGVSVEAYEFPGHTKGCMVFLVKEERILILGDACNNATFLFDDICSTVAEYKEQVRKTAARLSGKYDRVFLMHHVMEAPVSILAEMEEVCDTILAGKADDLPFEFMGKKACIAKTANERFERQDGAFANLIYNPELIR